MAFIDLTDVECQLAEPGMQDFGVLQKPVLGGSINKVDRLGGGHVLSYTVPPKAMEPDGRRLVARCQMAKRYGVILEVPQVDFKVGTPGLAITVASAVAGGRYVQITGATPRYAVRMGQALNITRNGHRYLYFTAAQVVLNGSGAGQVELTRPLRTKLLGTEAVNLAKPVIEGWIEGDNFSWPISMQRTTGLQFDVVERA
ncbi:hypothetical protein [Sphingobium cupriresistens]|uniref:Uncharacterized protein n=1 Tax=Sphingobium cupriresistens LL01 TaxID=1420583 RepID=A0A0J7XSS6_9SPHN|nr:hypothetical protein [Sphingobium cupriresistens]KMS54724.1 hypothetical protein V473_15410 [Sphingobium cupriresistens LL01]